MTNKYPTPKTIFNVDETLESIIKECTVIYENNEMHMFYATCRRIIELTLNIAIYKHYSPPIDPYNFNLHESIKFATKNIRQFKPFKNFLFNCKAAGNDEIHSTKRSIEFEKESLKIGLYNYLKWFYTNFLNEQLPEVLRTWHKTQDAESSLTQTKDSTDAVTEQQNQYNKVNIQESNSESELISGPIEFPNGNNLDKTKSQSETTENDGSKARIFQFVIINHSKILRFCMYSACIVVIMMFCVAVYEHLHPKYEQRGGQSIRTIPNLPYFIYSNIFDDYHKRIPGKYSYTLTDSYLTKKCSRETQKGMISESTDSMKITYYFDKSDHVCAMIGADARVLPNAIITFLDDAQVMGSLYIESNAYVLNYGIIFGDVVVKKGARFQNKGEVYGKIFSLGYVIND